MTRRAALGLSVLALGGCATPEPAEIGYLAPSGLPPIARSAQIQQQPDLVMGNLVDRLQQDAFTVTHLDERAGEVVVEYHGDPEPYVDCGWIVSYRTGGLDRIPAASARATFDREVAQSLVKLERQLQLDGRMVVTFDQEGPDTLVTPAATYVLTKTIDVTRPDGGPRGQTREMISFATGETGSFSKGTVCQPNGRLERVVLDSLPATSIARPSPRRPEVASPPSAAPPVAASPASPPAAASGQAGDAPAVAVSRAPGVPRLEVTGSAAAPAAAAPAAAPPVAAALSPEAIEARVGAATSALTCAAVDARLGSGNDVQLTGYVGSAADLAQLRQALGQIPGIGALETELEVNPWPFCELLAVIAPYRDVDTADDLGLAITTSGRTTVLREGDALTLDIFLPRAARYLYLGYVQQDGRVGYITTIPVREWAEGTGAIRFETGYEISEPFGREMIVAVTSARPLFDQPRPAYEPAADYIAALRQGLSALQAIDPNGVAASHVFITTEPNRAF